MILWFVVPQGNKHTACGVFCVRLSACIYVRLSHCIISPRHTLWSVLPLIAVSFSALQENPTLAFVCAVVCKCIAVLFLNAIILHLITAHVCVSVCVFVHVRETEGEGERKKESYYIHTQLIMIIEAFREKLLPGFRADCNWLWKVWWCKWCIYFITHQRGENQHRMTLRYFSCGLQSQRDGVTVSNMCVCTPSLALLQFEVIYVQLTLL